MPGLPANKGCRQVSPSDSILQTQDLPDSGQSGFCVCVHQSPAKPAMSVINMTNVTHRYGRRRGVENVSFQVTAGEIFGFLGPNGAGKSTTIRILTGFLKATSGHAIVMDKDCWRESDRIKADVGYVPGDVRLYPWLTTREALRMVGMIRRRDVLTFGIQLADRLQLDLKLPVRKMSRGTRQKVALVLALCHRPQLIILDEPTSGLDPLMQDQLTGLLRDFAAQGHTVFFSSHTLSEVETLCTRVAVIREGKIIDSRSVDELKRSAPRLAVLEFSRPEDAAECVFDGAMIVKREGCHVEFQLTGSSTDFVRWAAQLPIRDVRIERPDLQLLFRNYYGPLGAMDGRQDQEPAGFA